MPSMPVPELSRMSEVWAVLVTGYNVLNLQLILTVRDFCARISGVQLHGSKTNQWIVDFCLVEKMMYRMVHQAK